MKAYELLADESKWARKAYAYEVEGGPCDPKSENACAWCVLGAIDKCYSDRTSVDGGEEFRQQVAKLRDVVGNPSQWNDSRLTTYKKVITVLKELDI